jgi:uncharacterized membrane protein
MGPGESHRPSFPPLFICPVIPRIARNANGCLARPLLYTLSPCVLTKYHVRRPGAEIKCVQITSSISLTSVLPLVTAIISLYSTRPGHPLQRRVPAALRGAPLAFLLGFGASNILPVAWTSGATSWLALSPSAVSLLLLGGSGDIANGIKPVDRHRGMLLSFCIGAFGTVVGAAVAAVTLRGVLGPRQCAGLAAVFAATYVGGSLNYIAVGRGVALADDLLAAGLAADMCLMILYFGALFWRGRVENNICEKAGITQVIVVSDEQRGDTVSHNSKGRNRSSCDLPKLRNAVGNAGSVLQAVFPLVLAAGLQFFCAGFCTHCLQSLKFTSALDVLAVSISSMALSRIPKLRPLLRKAGPLSNISLMIFFSALGAATRMSSIIHAGPSVLCFALICLCVHVIFMATFARFIFRIPVRQCLVSSNANVGGSATAAAYAAALGWQELVPEAILMGALGYAIATPLGLGLAHVLGLLFAAS